LAVDDGSTKSPEILRTFAAAEPRIRVFQCSQNEGPSAARNRALREARGAVIAYLDCDDEYYPNYLQEISQRLSPWDVLVFAYDVVSSATDAGGAPQITTWDPARVRNRLMDEHIAVPLAVAHRRQLLDEVGLFNEQIHRDYDSELWRRFATSGALFLFVPLRSGRYYVRPDSQARTRRIPDAANAKPLEILQEAWQHHHRGNRDEAEKLYRHLVTVNPQNADALHSWGMLACQEGRHAESVDLIRRAIAINSQVPAYHNNLGVAQQTLEQFAEALASYREAVRLHPEYAPGHNNIGKILRSQGQWASAVQCFEQAVRIRPDFAEAWLNLGDALYQLEKFAQAAHCYEQAIAQSPGFIEAHNNLGVALVSIGRMEDARSCFQRALQLRPSFTEAQQNLGLLSGASSAINVGFADTAPPAPPLEMDAETCRKLGQTLQSLRRFPEAETYYRQSLRVAPEQAETHKNLGTLLHLQRRLDEAETCYREALRILPGLATAHNNLGNLLKTTGRLEEALTCYRQALQADPQHDIAHSNLLLDLNYDSEITDEQLFVEHRRWAEAHSHSLSLEPGHTNDRNPDRRLRIGYVSPDFSWHPVTRFFEPLMRYRDRRATEVFLYADVRRFDATSAALQASADCWRDVSSLNNASLAELIRTDAIDILVDLAGHTGDNRLLTFARKPAPIQMTYLGYPNTTGLETIDYRLTDAVADPEGEPIRHSETLLRLDPLFCCYAPPEESPPVARPPFLSRGYITFGCFQNLAKINGRVFDLWSALLRKLPTAKLRLCRDALNGSARDRIARDFAKRGISADRLELICVEDPRKSHLALYDDIDIALDPFPWTGHTTACEGLWMGVPVVTMRGCRHAGRMVTSVLSCLGLGDWIGNTPEAYLACAEKLANDGDQLACFRAELRGRIGNSPLCDGRSFMRKLEHLYRHIWEQWCAKGPVAKSSSS
jgi:predicted O-linked N-acetylglucosamine transferase (SPINDLY family)